MPRTARCSVICTNQRLALCGALRDIDLLCDAVRRVHCLHPFVIHAWVVLPDPMHCVWTLPPGDTAYSLRWRLIKTFFCRALPPDEYRSRLRLLRGERGIWQRRYWEHLIRDDDDFRRHVDYVHINPLKHGLVASLQACKTGRIRAFIEA